MRIYLERDMRIRIRWRWRHILLEINPNFKEKDDDKIHIVPHGSMQVTIRTHYTKSNHAEPWMQPSFWRSGTQSMDEKARGEGGSVVGRGNIIDRLGNRSWFLLIGVISWLLRCDDQFTTWWRFRIWKLGSIVAAEGNWTQGTRDTPLWSVGMVWMPHLWNLMDRGK
jgi:hypothetical protein